MQILLSRHGNTFASGDKVVWTGSKNDLPLVQTGLAQAENCAKALLESKAHLAAIYCGPLSRTHQYAQIISDRLGANTPVIVDERLNEIDYGDWTGLSNDEVSTKYGASEQDDWNRLGKWPKLANWTGSEPSTIADVRTFVDDLLLRHQNDSILIVSSNGKLRYFLTLIPDEFEQRRQMDSLKVKTGNLCKLTHTHGSFTVDFWNLEPHRALLNNEKLKI